MKISKTSGVRSQIGPPKKLFSRRDLGRVLGEDSGTLPRKPAPGPGYYLRLSRQAMACQFELFLRPADREFLAGAVAALAEVDTLEQQMTIYRDDSEVSALNRTAHKEPVVVEKRLYQLLRQAREIGRETGGAYDITAGPLIRCWGFLERKGRIPKAEDLHAARKLTGWEVVAFDDTSHSISFRKAGVELNLGSIGKGYALDRLAELLRALGLRDFLLHAGHSSVFAAGDDHSGQGWEISLRDPRAPGSLGSVKLKDQGMSTSGVGEQFFVAGGKRYGHLLDPRTGRPSTRTLSCSVVAPSAARAEALSTAFFVMRSEEVQQYCETHPEIGTLIVPAARNAEKDGHPKIIALRIGLRPLEVTS